MSNLWIILVIWICVNLAFVAIRLLATAQSDDASWRRKIRLKTSQPDVDVGNRSAC